jgi:hypothetical protein
MVEVTASWSGRDVICAETIAYQNWQENIILQGLSRKSSYVLLGEFSRNMSILYNYEGYK